jgi:hypothetical protein
VWSEITNHVSPAKVFCYENHSVMLFTCTVNAPLFVSVTVGIGPRRSARGTRSTNVSSSNHGRQIWISHFHSRSKPKVPMTKWNWQYLSSTTLPIRLSEFTAVQGLAPDEVILISMATVLLLLAFLHKIENPTKKY